MAAMYKKKAMNRKDLQQLAGIINYIAHACRPVFNGVSLVPASPPVLLIEADSCMEEGGPSLVIVAIVYLCIKKGGL